MIEFVLVFAGLVVGLILLVLLAHALFASADCGSCSKYLVCRQLGRDINKASTPCGEYSPGVKEVVE